MASTSPAQLPASSLDKTTGSGEGMIFYPSGNVAAVICRKEAGLVVTVMSDHSVNSVVLASFDNLGIGGVNYANGKPWVVVMQQGYLISDRKGAIVERGPHPRKAPEPLICEVNECLVVAFLNKQSITVSFSCEDLQKEWQCGERFKRTEVYTDKVVGRRKGLLELDVPQIRERQRTVGSVYVPRGPHHQQTAHSGLGGLKATLRKMPSDAAVMPTIRDLQSCDARVSQIDVMPRVLYGTSRALNTTGGSLEDFGAPTLSATQRQYAARIKAANAGPPKYKARRCKLPLLSMHDLPARVMSADAPRDTLCVLCVLADWNPVCSKVEAAMEAANSSLTDEALANGGSEAAKIKMFKVDASEGSMLRDRFGFRTVPMFFMFYQGQLVYASNMLSTADEARQAALAALTRGRKGETMPESFTFNGRDDQRLDCIRSDMALRGR